MIDKQLEMELDAFIEREKENLKNDIFSVVAIKSVSEKGQGGYPFGEGCKDVLDKALSLAKDYGFKTNNCQDHCGYVLYGENENSHRIGIFSHLDVVPEGNGWYNEPYKPVEKDGFLIGRGVADNKGAAMYSLYALRFLKEHGIKLNHDVLLYFGCSEETGMEDIEYFINNENVPYFSLVPDSNFPVCYGEKGIMRFSFTFKLPEATVLQNGDAGLVINSIPAKAQATINKKLAEKQVFNDVKLIVSDDSTKFEASGIASHAAFPEGSKNAINVLASALLESGCLDSGSKRIIESIEALTSCYDGSSLGVKCEDKESGALTVSGTLLKIEDGKLSLSFDMRYPVTIKAEGIIDILTEYAEEKGAFFEIQSNSKPAYTPIDSPEVQILCKVAEYVHKRKLEPYTMGGGTYSRMLPFAVGFGPGLSDAPNLFEKGRGNGHQCDECILYDNLLKGLKATVIALINLDKIL